MRWKFPGLIVLLAFALGPSAATQTEMPPWDSQAALTPVRMRKPWVPCYHTDPVRPDAALRMHDKFIGDLQAQQPAVLFVGDSLIGFWRRGASQASWKKSIEPLNAYNLGVAGDMTEHILWRLSNGELHGINPKVIVLLTGTNNLWRDTPEEITKAISAMIDVITKSTNAKILLVGIPPRNDRESRPDFDSKTTDLNARLAKLADGQRVRYFYFGDKFLDQDGKLAKGFLADGLHPTPRGYEVWGEQIRPVLDEMMK